MSKGPKGRGDVQRYLLPLASGRGRGEGAAPSDTEIPPMADGYTFLIQILNGVQYGLLLFLVASGLTLIFGIMGVINLAHGS